jgi:hypothetical protein
VSVDDPGVEVTEQLRQQCGVSLFLAHEQGCRTVIFANGLGEQLSSVTAFADLEPLQRRDQRTAHRRREVAVVTEGEALAVVGQPVLLEPAHPR